MIELIAPDAARYDDWSAMLREFRDATTDSRGDHWVCAGGMDGSGFFAGTDVDITPDGFAAYVEDCARQGNTMWPPHTGLVHCSYFWIVDDGALVGHLALRHALNEFLYELGGHIGYSVRPAARGRGIAKEALKLGLAEAAALDIAPVLVCCAQTNGASRAVIEACGGQLEDVREDSRRYWFGDGPRPTDPTA